MNRAQMPVVHFSLLDVDCLGVPEPCVKTEPGMGEQSMA